jgi:CDP-diglyceride synthetase
MARRAGVALTAAALLAIALFAGRVGFLFVLIVVAIATAGEMYRLVRARGVFPASWVGQVGIVAMLVVAEARAARAPASFPLVIVSALGLAFAVMLLRRNRMSVTLAVAYTLLPVLTVGLLSAYAVVLRREPGGFTLAWVFVMTALASEGGAGFLTWLARRRALTPRARRTREHVAGACAGALLAAVVAALGASPPFSWARAIILALLVAATVATGDLGWGMVEEDLARAAPAGARARAVMLPRVSGVLLSAPVFFYVFRALAS